MTCLSEHEAVALVEAGDIGGRAPEAEAHLDACSTCRRVVSALAIVRDLEREPRTPLRPGARLGRYVLERAIGEGGMAVIWEAFDEHLGRAIALKWIHPALSGDRSKDCARVLREARAAARVNHPNVVTIFDSGEHEGRAFIALELATRGTMRTWLRARTRSAEEIAQAFREAARGLAAAHRAGVVHGDFKPENVLVCDDGTFKVTDFGLSSTAGTATARVPSATSASASCSIAGGTPFYMAPERLAGGPPTERADQYAFGLALGAALEEHAPGSRRVAAALARLSARATASSPEQRFDGMESLVAVLDGALARRRARWGIVAAAVALACFALGVGWTARALGTERYAYANDLRNGGFEEGSGRPKHWLLSGGGRDSFDLEIMHDAPKSGQGCARLAPRGGGRSLGYGTAMQALNARDFRGKRVRVTAWVKSVGATERADFWTRARFNTLGVDGPELGAAAVPVVTDSNGEWRRYEVTLDVPLRTRLLDVGIGLDGPGTLFIDEVSLQIVLP